MDEVEKEKSIYRNVYGNELKLYVQEVSTCLQVTIHSSKKSLYIKSIFLFFTTILNIVLLHFNVVTINVIAGILSLILLFLYLICTTIVEEHFVIVKGLGIEITKRSVIGTKRMFYPQEQVQKVFINEVIFRGKILFVLTFLVKDLDNDKLVLLFEDILPQLALLKVVYKRIKHYL